MGVGLLVGVWVARYLGPEQFGLLNYATAFVALFGTIATMGLNGIVVRDLVRQPETANVTMGSAFLLQLLGALMALGLIIIAINFARPDDNLSKLMVTILGFTLIFKITDVVKYWFESQVQSRYSVWVENGVFLLLAAVKVGLILNGAPLIAFVWAVFIEALLVALGLLFAYAWRGGRLSVLQATYQRSVELLRDSWPLVLSGVAVMIYMRIDQIMLGQMLDNNAVGIYSAAVRITEVWYFIPIVIVSSVFPSLIESKKQSETVYCNRMQRLYGLVFLMALIIAVVMTFMSDWVVQLLFGSDYSESSSPLSLLVWGSVPVFLGVAWGKWLIIEGKQKLALISHIIGALLNIILNIWLIPLFGVVGCAIATLISYFVSAAIAFSLHKGRVTYSMIFQVWRPSV
jgi:PST family polysaccharide transporter